MAHALPSIPRRIKSAWSGLSSTIKILCIASVEVDRVLRSNFLFHFMTLSFGPRNKKLTSFSFFRFDPGFAAVVFHNFLDNAQSDAAALYLLRAGSTLENLEYLFVKLSFNPKPIVLHPKCASAVSVVLVTADFNTGFLGRAYVLHCILNQIGKYLRQTLPRTPKRRKVITQRDLDVTLVDLRPQLRNNLPQELFCI